MDISFEALIGSNFPVYKEFDVIVNVLSEGGKLLDTTSTVIRPEKTTTINYSH